MVLTKATEIIKVYELWDIFSFTVVIIIIRIQIKSLHKRSHTKTVSNLSAAQECLQRVYMGNIFQELQHHMTFCNMTSEGIIFD